MNKYPHIGAFDFDSQNIHVAVGTRDTTSFSQPLLRAESYPHESIRRGTIIESNSLTIIIGQILRNLENTYQYKIPIYLGVHPSSLLTRRVTVTINLFQNNQPRQITPNDCYNLEKRAEAIILGENPNLYILNIIPRQYIIDNTRLQIGASPSDYQASKLSCEMLILACLKHDVSHFIDIFENYHTDIYEVFPTPYSTSILITNLKQRIIGCGVLYMSSEVSSFLIFEDGQLTHMATFPIGIEDVVSDIAVGLQVNLDKARNFLSDHNRLNDESAHTKKRFFEIVNARYMDIVEKIEKATTSLGRPVVMPAGISLITTSIQLTTLAETIYNHLKIPTTLWEGDIPHTQAKRKNRDISIIGAYSIICNTDLESSPPKSKNIIALIIKKIKNFFLETIDKLLS